MPSQKIWFADLLRGAAALCVVVSHVTVPLWASAQQQPLAMSLLGQVGVGLFFLISGFLVPISLRSYTAKDFAIGRLLRIWPTYVAGFSLGLGLLLGFGTTPVSLRDMLGHYFLIQDVLNSQSIDGVIWTLQIETKFYVLCVVFASLFRSFHPALALVAVATWAYGLYGPNSVWSQEACWLLPIYIGVVYFWHFNQKLSSGKALAIGGLLFLGFVQAWLTRIGGHRTTFLFAYAAAQAIFLLGYIARQHVHPVAIFRWLSAISYPLYVVHVILAGVTSSLALRAGMPAVLAVAIAILVCLLVAALMHVLVERPTHRLGQRLRQGRARANVSGLPPEPETRDAGRPLTAS